MKVFRVLFLFLFTALVLSMAACDEGTYWAKNYYQNDKGHYSWSTIETSDNGFLHLANTFSFTSVPDKAYVMKLNQAGDVQWQKNISSGTDAERFTGAIQSGDSYLLAGINSNYDSSTWLMKINSSGTSIAWEKTYTIDNSSFYPYGFVKSFNSGYIFAGDNCLIEIDENGDHVQNKVWSTSDFSLQGITRTGDGYILISQDTSGGLKLMKLNTSGNLVWAKLYTNSNGTLELEGNSSGKLASTSDNGCVITAAFKDSSTQKTDLTVLKINSDGSLGWQKLFSRTLNSSGGAIDVASNGEIIVSGSYETGNTANPDLENNTWILELNSSGNPQWQLGTSDPIDVTISVDAISTGYSIAGMNELYTSNSSGGWNTALRSALIILDGDGKTSGDFTYETPTASVSSIVPTVTDISITLNSGVTSVTDASSTINDVIFSINTF